MSVVSDRLARQIAVAEISLQHPDTTEAGANAALATIESTRPQLEALEGGNTDLVLSGAWAALAEEILDTHTVYQPGVPVPPWMDDVSNGRPEPEPPIDPPPPDLGV